MQLCTKTGKVNKKIYRNYIYMNGILLVLSIYVIFFPFIANIMTSIFPYFNQCAYLTMTGKPCPLCGGTRYIANLGQSIKDIRYLFHPFGIIVIFIFLETIFRIANLIWLYQKKEVSKKIIIIDAIIHVIALLSLITYEIIFFI